MAELPSGTVTFLFTDIEGSTARWEGQPEAMRVALARHDALIREAIVEHHGHVVKTMGDAFHAAFARASDALAAAVDGQRRLQAEPWSEIGPLRVRMALHTGAAEERDGDYYGPALNRAARLLAIGHGGQVLLSDVAAGLVRDALSEGSRLLDLGRHRLKDLIEPERVFQLVSPDLASDFPPLLSLDARPHNLPTHPTALLGRERELAEVRKLFEDGARLVTLTGPGGTGKTRLGLQVAADLLDDFEHGVFLVDLAPISDPALVPSTIAQVLGVRDVGNRPVLDALKDYVRARALLLVLDNFEQIVSGAPVVGELLAACPGLKALVTSREPLRLRGEVEYAVPPLTLPEAHRGATLESIARSPAIALFVERAVSIRTGFALTSENAQAVSEICARVDGLPLAIELAAARVRMMPPQTMAQRLERRLPLLTEGSRDLPARQQTLRDTIGWSYDLLDEQERRLLRRLAVFVGGWTLESAEAVCLLDDSDADVLDGLYSLVAKSLVREEEVGGEARYTMLETIREYALEQLGVSDESGPIQRRHADYLVDLAEEAEPHLLSTEQREWLLRLDREQDNFRSVLGRTTGSDEKERALRLAGALSWYWFLRSRLREGTRWLEAALVDSNGLAGSVRAKALWGAGMLVRNLGDHERAAVLHEEGLALRRRLGDRHGTAWSVSALGMVAMYQADLDRADALFGEGLKLFRATGDAWAIGWALGNLALVANRRGDDERVVALLDEGLPLQRQAGDQWTVGRSLQTLGDLAERQGDDERAMQLFEDGLALYRNVGNLGSAATLILNIGRLAHRHGDTARGLGLLQEGLALSYDLAHGQGIVVALHELGRAAGNRGDWVRAGRLLGRAEALREEMGTPSSATHLADLASVQALLGGPAFATAWAEGRAMTLEQAVAYALDEPPFA